jgi:predicted PurR-regulated permease PerM
MIGPVLVGIILIAFAFMGGWVKVLLALLFTVLIQQIEHNVFMPLFTKKMVGIPNFLVLISILVGGELLGVIGAILAIPLGAILYETLKNYSLYKKEQN